MSTSPQFRILCVDDEESGLNLRKLILERKGYDVAATGTVSEALELFRGGHFDLVLTDHHLGRETGTAMTREMKRLKPYVPILVLSGAADTAEGIEMMDGFISKADGVESLLMNLHETLARTRPAVNLLSDVPAAEEPPSAESHQILAAIVESSDDAIISQTLDGKILSWNKAAERMYGYRAEEVIGKPISILLPPDRPNELRDILEWLRHGGRIEHLDTLRMAKDGHLVTVSLTVSPVRDSSGRVIGASTITRDTTNSKLAEESLRHSEKLAVAGRMTATVAHEIRNPLEAVANALYLLSDSSSLDGSAREFLRTAQDELSKVRQIINLTLGQHRGNAEKPEQVRISEVIDSVLNLYGQKLRALDVDVKTTYDSEVPVSAFPGELRQVFSNLIMNAADALEKSGDRLRIHVFASRDWNHPSKTGLRITVSDNGCGIPPEKRAHLFEPFYTTKGSKGTGLGLWVSHGIVKKYGGTIRLRSTVRPDGCGTTFAVFLPITRP